MPGASRINFKGCDIDVFLPHKTRKGYGMEICLGTISNTEERVREVLEAPVEEAKDFVKEQGVVHADETGHKKAGEKAWMWVAVTSFVSVFLIRCSRGQKVAKELLGEFLADF
jgi:transposase